MSGYHPSDGRHRLRFDDNQQRLLNMRGKPFAWIAPRSRGAGYSSRLHAAMVLLGATNILAAPCPREANQAKLSKETLLNVGSGTAFRGYPALPPHFAGVKPGSPEEAVGKTLCFYWRADGRWYPGKVVQHNSKTKLHYVLFCDGEDEWMDLTCEDVVWGDKEDPAKVNKPTGVCYGE